MVAFASGQVVLLPFPFSDLTASKLRPALVLADSGKGDWILCQITSNPYADPSATTITDAVKPECHVQVVRVIVDLLEAGV